MIPPYPEWIPVDLSLREELHPAFLRLNSGISEFTFSNIYLFRNTYGYRVSRVGDDLYALSGSRHGKTFFALPWGPPREEILADLFSKFDYWKNADFPQTQALSLRPDGILYEVREDRDNWDYLYDIHEMAELEGKKFHKKRNLIHHFNHEYGELRVRALSEETVADGLTVLDHWATDRDDTGDLVASREAIMLWKELELTGGVFYLGDRPVGYNLGEWVQQGKSFILHFEKADNQFKGVYQTLFQACAKRLVGECEVINREQDLGDPGLRQAKETYRPVDFVRKYQVWKRT